jgi:hypothetical protein
LSLTKGFDRLVALDTAKNKLESLNKAASKFGKPMVDVKQAVQDVTDVVSGTPFSLDEAFGTAVGAIGAGVKDVKGYMTTVADAAAIGGTSMAEMGDVFQDIVNKGNVTGESLARLDTRFPATSWIKASVTASGQDFDALLAKGEITMAMLQQSINDNAAGMAQGLGNTLQGAIMNMQTAVARVGANFLTALVRRGVRGSGAGHERVHQHDHHQAQRAGCVDQRQQRTNPHLLHVGRGRRQRARRMFSEKFWDI